MSDLHALLYPPGLAPKVRAPRFLTDVEAYWSEIEQRRFLVSGKTWRPVLIREGGENVVCWQWSNVRNDEQSDSQEAFLRDPQAFANRWWNTYGYWQPGVLQARTGPTVNYAYFRFEEVS